MKFKRQLRIKRIILAVAGILNRAGADAIRPSDGEWIAMMRRTDFYYDAAGDKTPGAIDLIGMTDTYSAGYWALIADGHIDIAVPWNTFTNLTNVKDVIDIRAVLSTSTTHSGIGGDAPLGASLTDQISDVLSDTIPEPAGASLLLGAGFGFLVFRRIFNRHDTDNINICS